jgi:hypothetical protein
MGSAECLVVVDLREDAYLGCNAGAAHLPAVSTRFREVSDAIQRKGHAKRARSTARSDR